MECKTKGCIGEVAEHKLVKGRCKACISFILFILGNAIEDKPV